jgi:hypothetical protein
MTIYVNLDVRNSSSGGNDRWVDVQASNGQTYSYKYTGGSDDAGNVTATVGGGTVTIEISIAATDPRYAITGVPLVDPDAASNNPQLSQSIAAGGRSATITDIDTAADNAAYCVTITDTSANCTIPCDPRITNVEN